MEIRIIWGKEEDFQFFYNKDKKVRSLQYISVSEKMTFKV